jgi:hypothetical protein
MNPSYFSQVPSYYTNAQYCDIKYSFIKAADNYTASFPFSNMRFWGVDDGANNMQPNETFLIEFWNGVPGAGGAVVKSYNVSIIPVLTPYISVGSDIYQFDINFGETITQLTGWVSISRTTASSTGLFAWLINNTYGNSISLVSSDGWVSVDATPFFCLGVGMHNFECMEDYVFSQVPDIYTNGYYCDADYAYTKVADNYSASAPLSSMRFWGAEDGNNIQTTETFLIEFYNGEPGQPGTSVVQAFNVTADPVQTPYQIAGFDIYQFDVDFPWPVTQMVGWVSVSRTTAIGSDFGWLTFEDVSGDFLQYYSPGSGTWITQDGYQFFCLGPVTPVTPVANWALYLGIGLILAFTVIRLRKIF